MAAMLECTEGKLAGVRSIHDEHVEGEAGLTPVMPIKLQDNDAEVHMDADSEGTVAVVYGEGMSILAALDSFNQKTSLGESEMNSSTVAHLFGELGEAKHGQCKSKTPSRKSVIVLVDTPAVYLDEKMLAEVRSQGYVPLLHGGGTTAFMQVNDTYLHGAIDKAMRAHSE